MWTWLPFALVMVNKWLSCSRYKSLPKKEDSRHKPSSNEGFDGAKYAWPKWPFVCLGLNRQAEKGAQNLNPKPLNPKLYRDPRL